MATVFGYVHFSVGMQEIDDAKARLAAAGASTIVVEPSEPYPEDGPAALTPLKKQPALFDLIAAASSGDTIMAVRLYHLAPAILRLLFVTDKLRSADVALVMLDDGLDSRQSAAASVFPAFDALAAFVEEYRSRHGGDITHIMEGNGGD